MENRNTKPNGDKIRELRRLAGMTQDMLGIKSNMDRRTIQRAEAGRPLQMESLSSIASALGVPLPQLIDTSGVRVAEESEDLAAQSLIVLRPQQSGRALIDMIASSFDGKITCEAEPTTGNIDALTAITSAIESMMPDPWRTPMEDPKPSLTEQLRTALELGEQIKQLTEHEIAIFAATYTAQAQIPRYDMDTGDMYVSQRTPYNLVTICRIMLASAARGDRITLKVDDLYVPPKAPAFGSGDVEDIPF
jgi:transcriptional regulator with XRE-family HTH domain